MLGKIDDTGPTADQRSEVETGVNIIVATHRGGRGAAGGLGRAELLGLCSAVTDSGIDLAWQADLLARLAQGCVYSGWLDDAHDLASRALLVLQSSPEPKVSPQTRKVFVALAELGIGTGDPAMRDLAITAADTVPASVDFEREMKVLLEAPASPQAAIERLLGLPQSDGTAARGGDSG